jgi:hypothetical protein
MESRESRYHYLTFTENSVCQRPHSDGNDARGPMHGNNAREQCTGTNARTISFTIHRHVAISHISPGHFVNGGVQDYGDHTERRDFKDDAVEPPGRARYRVSTICMSLSKGRSRECIQRGLMSIVNLFMVEGTRTLRPSGELSCSWRLRYGRCW